MAGLWRYPVKSMAAEALTEAEVSWHGVAGDRRWAFVRAGQSRNGFPWLTMRQRPDLCRYRPSLTDPDRPDVSPTVVRTPPGTSSTSPTRRSRPNWAPGCACSRWTGASSTPCR